MDGFFASLRMTKEAFREGMETLPYARRKQGDNAPALRDRVYPNVSRPYSNSIAFVCITVR